jgi:hypothetical protein
LVFWLAVDVAPESEPEALLLVESCAWAPNAATARAMMVRVRFMGVPREFVGSMQEKKRPRAL